jgi:hypothetical protein
MEKGVQLSCEWLQRSTVDKQVSEKCTIFPSKSVAELVKKKIYLPGKVVGTAVPTNILERVKLGRNTRNGLALFSVSKCKAVL